jgi:hypothetical protein
MIPQTKKPPERSGAGGFQNTSQQRNFIKKPPYYNSLDLSHPNCCLIVCTGSGAWERAKSSTWFSGCKILLPFGGDPASYAWSIVAGHDVMIAGFGDLEPISTIAKLASLLLAAGAALVLYAPEHGNMIRIEARRTAA